MKTFAVKNKHPVPVFRGTRSHVHSPLGPKQKAQQTEIHHILRSTGAQAKLTIGQPNDKYEQEADRVADQVMAMPDPKLQRQAENEEEEETLQTKLLADQVSPLLQRQEDQSEEDEEPIQTKLAERNTQLQRQTQEAEEEESVQTKRLSNESPPLSVGLRTQIQSLKGGGQPLPGAERTFFESRFGRNFASVRLHTDNRAVRAAQSINARAFTLGNDVVFGNGEYTHSTSSGRRLLAHELTHVVQQRQTPSIPRKIYRDALPKWARSHYSKYILRKPPYSWRLFNFYYNKPRLRTVHKAALKYEIAPILWMLRKASVGIIGHASIIGEGKHNKLLSERRANRVFKYLMRRGVKSRYIHVYGVGNERPLDPQNKRNPMDRAVRIILLPLGKAKPNLPRGDEPIRPLPPGRIKIHDPHFWGRLFRVAELDCSMQIVLGGNAITSSCALLTTKQCIFLLATYPFLPKDLQKTVRTCCKPSKAPSQRKIKSKLFKCIIQYVFNKMKKQGKIGKNISDAEVKHIIRMAYKNYLQRKNRKRKNK